MTSVQVSEIIRNYGLVFGGAVGLAIAAWRSFASNKQADAALKQTDLAQRDHIIEIFNRAIGQLADDKLEVRLGAIYTLREICLDKRYSDNSWPIIETMSAYVRERTSESTEALAPVDIQAISDLLRDYSAIQKVEEK